MAWAWMMAAGLALIASMAGAQTEEAMPNPLRDGGPVACDGWAPESDAATMAALAGMWEGSGLAPAVPDLRPETPFRYYLTAEVDGTFRLERLVCFPGIATEGQTPLEPICGQAVLTGQWAATKAEDGAITIATRSAGNDYTGQELPETCGTGTLQQVDADTLTDSHGSPILRFVN